MNIQAGELRLGSIVNLKDKGLYIIDCGHDIEELEGWHGTDYLTGVALNDEVLEGLGFIKVSHNSQFYAHPIVPLFKVTINDELGVMIAWDNHYLKSVKIKYAHELQNIYHSLTGNELTPNKPF